MGREITEMEGCEVLLRGALPGEGDLLPDKNAFTFKERVWTDCIVQHSLQMFRGALGKTIFNEPQDALFEPGRVCYSSVQV